MDKIPFVDGTKISNAKVTIDEQEYEVTPAQYSGTTPVSAFNLNKMQDNIENAIPITNTIKVSATEPSPKADVWIKYALNLFDGEIQENYGYNTNTGALETNSTTYCNKNKIKVDAGKTILLTKDNNAFAVRYFFYTNNNVYISQALGNATAVKVPTNASFVNFHFAKTIVDNDPTGLKLRYTPVVENDVLVNDNGEYRSILPIQDYTLNQEKKIGKWITGEDLYSMTVQGTSPKVTTDGTYGTTTYIDLSNRNIKQGMLRNSWIIDTGNNVIGLPYLTNSGNVIKSFFNINFKKVEINCNVKNYSEVPIIAEVIYTKN